MNKKYEELNFTDDFMFCKILYNNPELCKKLLELILRTKIKEIKYLAKQESIDITSDGKGVRLDVYLEDENKVYDIEMQTTGNSNLPKRTRYYQGMIDLNLIEKGADYQELKESFIIFICLHDPFYEDRCIYTFENRCRENTDISLGDESTKVFLNASGNKRGIDEELRCFLEFLSGKEPQGNLAIQIAEKVKQATAHEEWRTEYMTLLQRDREKFAEGKEEGKREGRKEGRKEERIVAVRNMMELGIPKEKILQKYTLEELQEAEAMPIDMK